MSRRLSDNSLFALAFLIALTLRLVNLGLPSLTDLEAGWALQALRAADGLRPVLGPFPAYLLPTALLFFLFEPTNFLARLVPALAGASLAFLPLLFRHRLGRRPALVLAFALAVEPGLTALSRQAGTPIPAIACTLFAWGLWENDRPRAAGFLAGLALLSGPSFWAGLLGLALAAGLLTGVGPLPPSDPAARGKFHAAWPWTLGALLSGGLLFFFSSNGLSAFLSALPEYLGGWTRPAGVPVGRMAVALLAYPLMAIPFALTTLVRGVLQRQREVIGLGLWLSTALLLAFAYPARQVGDLAWALIPLWTLAALEIARALQPSDAPRAETLGTLALTLIILVFLWFDFVALAGLPVGSEWFTTRVLLLAGGLLLLALSLLLVALGWSPEIATRGATHGVLIALGLYTLAQALYAPGLHAGPPTTELWTLGPAISQEADLVGEVEFRSILAGKQATALPVRIAEVDSPALEWALRRHDVTLGPPPVPDAPGLAPPLIVTGPSTPSSLLAAYRGQDFVWQRPFPASVPATAWLAWLPHHRLTLDSQIVILWVRADLFPDH